MSQYVPTRYKVLCIIDKQCRVKSYVRGEAVYIYMSLRGQVCARVMTTPVITTCQVSAVTLYSLLFTINSLKAALNTNQEGYIYKKLLKSFCYVKVLQVLKTILNYLSNINIKSIKEAGKCFIKIRQQGVIYIIVAHSKRSGWGNRNL